MHVDMKNFAVFRAAGGIVLPNQGTQRLGIDAWSLTNELEDPRLDRRQNQITRNDRLAACRADLKHGIFHPSGTLEGHELRRRVGLTGSQHPRPCLCDRHALDCEGDGPLPQVSAHVTVTC